MLNNLKNKGITLIALVISIIVLLILAGISISMLSGDNSILKKAGEARDIAVEKGVAERVQIAYLAAVSKGKGDATEANLTEALDKEFGNGNYALIEDLSGATIYGKEYLFDGTMVNGSWKQKEDGTIENSDGTITGIKIGDYVNYDVVAGLDTSNTSVTTIKSNGIDNGYGDQTFDLNKYTGDNKWRILGVKKGKIELISTELVPMNDDSTDFYLQGRVGYQNAQTELNKIASLYGHGTHATGARSVNVDDINKITGYNPNAEGIKNPTAEQIINGNKYEKNQINEYGNKVTYSWIGTNYPKYTSTNGLTGTLSSSHNNYSFGNGFFWYDFNNNIWKKSAYTTSQGEITKITSTSYKYYPETLTKTNDTSATTGIANNSVKRQLLFEKNYWLASRSVGASSSVIYSYVRDVYEGYIHNAVLSKSNGSEESRGRGIRPVVSLESNTQLEPNGTQDGVNAWKFK